MITIEADLCIGCGRCVEDCPQYAISIVSGRARINQRMCNQCRLCLGLCPRDAIVELAAVSEEKLKVTVGSLKLKADGLIKRIEKLRLASGIKQ